MSKDQSKTTRKMPKRIWLTDGDWDAKVMGEADELTWCEDKITNHDVEYVRADLCKKQ